MFKRNLILIILSSVLFACAVPQTPAPASVPPTQGVPPTAVPPTTVSALPTAASGASPVKPCLGTAPLTPAMTEGPYYKANTPKRESLLEPNTKGIKLVVSGFVMTTECTPIANAWLDFWQADAEGKYDNAGYILRGHQFTNASGRYQLTTIIPGLYPGRTEHIHFKVQAPNGPVLTSQLFFPDVPQNKSDGIFDTKLLLDMTDAPDGKQATFNFVINTK